MKYRKTFLVVSSKNTDEKEKNTKTYAKLPALYAKIHKVIKD